MTPEETRNVLLYIIMSLLTKVTVTQTSPTIILLGETTHTLGVEQ